LSKNLKIQAIADEEILKLFLRNRDMNLLGQLLEKYLRFTFLICLKYTKNKDDAQDICMQVFEKITKDVHKFEIANFKSWLHVVAKNECLMHLRAKGKEVTTKFDSEKNASSLVENDQLLHHEYDHDKEQQLQNLEAFVNELAEGQRACVQLFFLEEKSYKEVSEITGFSLIEVKSHIQNGKRNLKNMLTSKGDILLYLLACFILFKNHC
jgi:RNA polymerase sigma factor (sigma-70 family)